MKEHVFNITFSTTNLHGFQIYARNLFAKIVFIRERGSEVIETTEAVEKNKNRSYILSGGPLRSFCKFKYSQ
jgi:hypothetical protein